MDDKSKTLPRAKRDKSPSPSASSAVSIRSLASEKLKKIPLVGRKKKKKKNANLLQVPTNDVPRGSFVEAETDVSEVEVTSAEESNSTSSPPGDLYSSTTTLTPSPAVSRKSVDFAAMEKSVDLVVMDSPASKSPKSKKRLKSLLKGGRSLFSTKSNKNESAPILVDVVGELRRNSQKGRDEASESSETGNDTAATTPTSIPEVVTEEVDVDSSRENESLKEWTSKVSVSETTASGDDDTEDYDWSISSTCARVKKLSIADIRESVYAEVDDNEDEMFDQSDVRSVASFSLTSELTEDEMSAKKFGYTSVSVPATPDPMSDLNDQTSLTFNKKSPSTLKKEILQITKHRKASEQYGNGALVINRKASLQARNPSDKNELLFKILVIGEISTGKTSIIKRYVHQFFSQHYRATIGVDFALKVLSWDNNTTIRLQLWDIAGQERFGSMTRVYYKEAVGAFIVFDVTRASTFDAVVKWKQDLDSKIQLPDGGPIPCVLLANKCDQPKEVIVNNQTKMDEFCKENRFIAWFETSAKDNINIDEAAHCLVTKIVQNDQERQDEKETVNGKMTRNASISLDNFDGVPEKKSCAC